MRPPLIPELESLASRGRDDVARLLGEAYALGRSHMRQELMRLLSPPSGIEVKTTTPVNTSPAVVRKLPPGTVKPAIRALVANSSGLSPDEIIATTGFKENSVRGTLAALSKDGSIERRGYRWYPVSQQRNEPPPESAGGS